MARAMEAAVLAALTASTVHPCYLFEIELASSTLNYWTGNTSLSWNSKTWLANGYINDVGRVRENGDLSAEGIEVSFVGEPSALIAIHLNEVRQNKPAKVYLGFLTEARAIIVSPIVYFSGRVDTSRLEDNVDEATITFAIESALIDLMRPRDLRYNHESQQSLYPGDMFFEYVEQLQDAHFLWGRKKWVNRTRRKARQAARRAA
jgi:hypothetical protein